MKNREFSRKITNYIWNEIEKLSNHDLYQVIRECKKFNQTNCSWLEYQLGNSIIDVAEGEIRKRAYKQKQGK